MKKKISIILTIMIVFVLISGCGSKNSSTENKNVKILFSVSDAKDSFRSILTKSAESYAESENIDLTVVDEANSIENQVTHMKEAVSGGYDVILCAPVDPNTTLQLKRAAGGLPIVFINSAPNDKQLEKNKYIYTSSNEEVAGQYQAEYVIDYLKNKNDIKVVLFKGEKEHSATIGRTKAVKQTFKEKGINAEYVFEDSANWSRVKTKEMFNVFLSTGRKFDCVISNNDEMALGVIDSLRENKIDPSSIPITGIDATSDACKAVLDGSMKLTVYQNAKDQSKSAMEAAVKLGSGGTLSDIENLTDDGKYIWVPFEKVDKSNVNKYMN